MSGKHSAGCYGTHEHHNHQGHDRSHEHGEFNLGGEIAPLGVSLVLFLVGLIFH